MRRRESTVQRGEACFALPCARREVRVSHLAVAHHPSKRRDVVWRVVRPEGVPLVSSDTVEHRGCVRGIEARPQQEAQERALRITTRSAGSVVARGVVRDGRRSVVILSV